MVYGSHHGNAQNPTLTRYLCVGLTVPSISILSTRFSIKWLQLHAYICTYMLIYAHIRAYTPLWGRSQGQPPSQFPTYRSMPKSSVYWSIFWRFRQFSRICVTIWKCAAAVSRRSTGGRSRYDLEIVTRSRLRFWLRGWLRFALRFICCYLFKKVKKWNRNLKSIDQKKR